MPQKRGQIVICRVVWFYDVGAGAYSICEQRVKLKFEPQRRYRAE